MVMAWIKKRLGLGKPDTVEQSILAAARDNTESLRERLERLERIDVVKARQDLKRRAFD